MSVSALGEMFMTCASHLQLGGFEASALNKVNTLTFSLRYFRTWHV